MPAWLILFLDRSIGCYRLNCNLQMTAVLSDVIYILGRSKVNPFLALAIPIFLFAMIMILFLFRMMQVQYLVGNSLDRAAAEASLFGGLSQKEAENLAKAMFYKELAVQKCPVSGIELGAAGFSWNSGKGDSDFIDLSVSYRMRFPLNFFGRRSLSFSNSCRMHRWTGNHHQTAMLLPPPDPGNFQQDTEPASSETETVSLSWQTEKLEEPMPPPPSGFPEGGHEKVPLAGNTHNFFLYSSA